MLDTDIVEVSGSVNRRHQVRLGDEDDVVGAALAADVARQRAVAARRLPVSTAQDAEAGGFDRLQGFAPFFAL